MADKNISCCGLDCGTCPAFIAFKTDDHKLRDSTAKEWSQIFHADFTADMINCTGCTNQKTPKIGHCSSCKIRLCTLKNKLKRCCSCKEFQKCDNRKSFENESGLKIS